MGDFRDDLLEALKDKKVCKRIREIVSEDEKKGLFPRKESDDKWKKEADRLGQLLEQEKAQTGRLGKLLDMEREKSEELRRFLDSSREECEMLKRDQARQQNQIRETETRLQRLEAENSYYGKCYSHLDRCYQLYARLGDSIHRDLSRVLSVDSPESFLVWGVQWVNIEALWDFMAISLEQKTCSQEILGALGKIFDYFFEQYSRMTGTYERLHAGVGDEFDEMFHRRSGDSLIAGRISQVLLQGYRGTSNKKIQKSVVKI